MARRRKDRSARVRPLESLEPRLVFDRGLAPAAHVVPIEPHPELDGFARSLVQHPLRAEREGLGRIARELREHPAFARRHGLGTLLAFEIAAHPRYAARHGLTVLITPAGPPASTSPAPTSPAPAPSTPTGPVATDPTSPAPTAPVAPPASPTAPTPTTPPSSVTTPPSTPTAVPTAPMGGDMGDMGGDMGDMGGMTGMRDALGPNPSTCLYSLDDPPPPCDGAVGFELCDGCQDTAGGDAAAPGIGIFYGPTTRSSVGGSETGLRSAASLASALGNIGGSTLNSDVGLVTGELFMDHPVATYSSLGGTNVLDLQYSSLQADSRPVIQAQFTTQTGSNSANLTSITAQLTVNGTSQGSAVTYSIPGGFADGSTYRIPLQANTTGLATGIYTDTFKITKTFTGGSFESMTYAGTVGVVNAGSASAGAGWSFGGVQKLNGVGSSSMLEITAGSQGRASAL